MHEIYATSRGYVEDIVGPDYLPREWIRKEVIRPNELGTANKKPEETKKQDEAPKPE
jgi:hypothetical protein